MHGPVVSEHSKVFCSCGRDCSGWNAMMIIIYYINMCILCVCVFVISEISGTGGRSATLLAPTWRASPGELQLLLLDNK